MIDFVCRRFSAYVLMISGTLTCACNRYILPHSYNNIGIDKRIVIPMDNTMHLKPLVSTIDSPEKVYKLLDIIFLDKKNELEIVVYFMGGEKLDAQRARIAGYTLRKLLIAKNYDSTRIAFRESPARFRLKKKMYPYRRIDFVVTRP